MALTGESPFAILKTHGLVVDDNGEKISKSIVSSNYAYADPDDLIEGTVKLDGTRKFGYGIDVIRAWCTFKDCDKNMFVMKEQLEQVNKEVKMFRDVIRVLLANVQKLDVNKDAFDFDKLSIVDKMMMVKLLQFSKSITETYDKFDLKEVYEKTLGFVVHDVVNFYLEFSKHRKHTDNLSTRMVMHKVVNTLLLTSAPILCFTS